MNKSYPRFAPASLRKTVAILAAYLTLVAPLAPVFAQSLKIKRAQTPAPAAPAAPSPSKGGGSTGTDKNLTLPAPKITSTSGTPNVVATKSDSFPDPDGNGKAEPGDTITYTVTITNNGTGDATGVQFTDSVDTNTTLSSSSVHASPVALDESYTTVANTLLEVGITSSGPPAVDVSGSVYDNDSQPNNTGGTDAFQYASNSNPSHGTLTFDNATGHFSYLPNVGYIGSDSFTYTIRNNNANSLTATGTVNLTVGAAGAGPTNVIWYVDNSYAGANGASDGRSTRPFQSLTPVNGAGGAGDSDAAGDIIYLATGNAAYTTGIILENSEQLVGGGVALTVPVGGTPTTLKAAGTRPTLQNASGNVVALASGNTVTGLNTGATSASGVAIFGSGFGTATINNLAVGSSPAHALDLTTGTLAITLDSIGSSGNGTGINLSNTGGTLTVTGGTTISNAVGINVAGASFPTISFNTNSGSLSVTSSAGAGITATGGTFNISGTTNTVSATGGPAVSLSAVSLGTGATFSTVSSTNSSSAVGGLSLTSVSGAFTANGGSISGGTSGPAFFVSGGSANITYAGTISMSSAQRAVSVSSHTGGTVTFSGAITANTNSTGILLSSNGGATFSFTGGLSIDTSTSGSDAFAATGGGTVTVTQDVPSNKINTLKTGSGAALKVQNTNIGASGLTFRSINAGTGAGSAGDGIILDTTGTVQGTNGGLTVTGNAGSCTSSATCTGGTIQHKTGTDGSTTDGIGIYLNSTRDVSLTNMQLNDFDNFGIFGNNVTNVTFTGLHVDGSNGNGAAATNEGAIRFTNLLGNATVTGSDIRNTNAAGGAVTTFSVSNSSGTLTLLDIENTTIANFNASTTGNDAFDFMSPAAASSATMNLKINNSSLIAARQFNFQLNLQGTTTSDVTITSDTFRNDISAVVGAGGGSNMTGGNSGSDVYVHYLIQNNNFRVSNGTGSAGPTNAGRSLTVGGASGGCTFEGKILSNTFGVSGVSRSGSGNAADALGIFASGNNGSHGDSKTLIQGNTIKQYGEVGILLNARQGSSVLDATILGNTINEPGPAAQGAFGAIWANVGALAGDTNTMNLAIGSATIAANKNTMQDSDPNNQTDVFLENDSATGCNPGPCSTHLNLFKNGSASSTAAGVITDDNNPTLNLVGFTSGTITLQAGLPTQPPVADPVDFPPPPPAGSAAPQQQAAPAAASNDITSHPFLSLPQAAKPAKGSAQAQALARLSSPSAEQQSQQPPVSKGEPSRAKPIQPIIQGAGGSISISVGTLAPGDSVTITFQVSVDNPYSGPANVSNQGRVTGSNFTTVNGKNTSIAGGNTDDPQNPGPAGSPNATLTPIDLVNIRINDAKVAEPTSGSAQMLFTVQLSAPAPSNLSLSYATAVGGANPATPGAPGAPCDTTFDYEQTSGTLNFATGQQVATIPVNVCHDNDNAESNETLLMNISNPTTGQLTNSQATGTITPTDSPGTLIISEIRTSGPGAAGTGDVNDDFVELYNNTNSPLTIPVGGYGVFKMGATCTDVPVLVGTVPAGTNIPARGHYLLVGSGYSLSNYPAGVAPGATTATGDASLTADIGNDSNVGVFTTTDPTLVSTANRLDAVGFGSNTGSACDLLREGTTLPAVAAALGSSPPNYSYFRNLSTGLPADTNNNSADFLFADVAATPVLSIQRLGAPGPENLASPFNRGAQIKATLFDPQVPSSAVPNRDRSATGVPNGANGTLVIRRTFTNNTGNTVTRLRFRVVDMTAGPGGGPGIADVRLLDTTGGSTNITGGGSKGWVTMTLEQPPTQTMGGGVNSTVTAVPPGGTLIAGDSINIQFTLGVQTPGNFRFFVIVEALP